MKLQLSFLLGLLLALLVVAAPAAEPEPEADLTDFDIRDAFPDPNGMSQADWVEIDKDEIDPRDTSPQAIGLAKRKIVQCRVVNTSSAVVNCRSGPGFNYKIISTLDKKHYYTFDCYKKGPCFNGNCTWDRRRLTLNGKSTHCYVNGYYTSSACTAKALGLC